MRIFLIDNQTDHQAIKDMNNLNKNPQYREVSVTALSPKVERRCIPIYKDTDTHEGYGIIGFARKPSSRKAGVHYFFREAEEPFKSFARASRGEMWEKPSIAPYVPHNIQHNKYQPIGTDNRKRERVQKAREMSANSEFRARHGVVSDDYDQRIADEAEALAIKHHIAD